MYNKVAIIIPARIGSTRLPRKPLELIGNDPMIVHVMRAAQKTNLANVYVATDSEEIAAEVRKAGGKAVVMATKDHYSGTDYVYKVIPLIEGQEKLKYIVNVQGDMPFVSPEEILSVVEDLIVDKFPIITPVTNCDLDTAKFNSNVKAVIDKNNKALYFSRSLIPSEGKEFLYHVGIYGFHRDTLAKLVGLEKTKLEKDERLEQLRALENGIEIGVCHVHHVPISVDTMEDLQKARAYYSQSLKA